MAHAIEKLPKWAQEIINRQERKIADQRNIIRELANETPPIGIWQVVDHGHGVGGERVHKNLTDEEVMFALPNPTKPEWPDIEIGVMRRSQSGKTFLSVNSRRALSVTPHSANVIHIHVEDY